MVRRTPKTMIISKVSSNGCRLVIFYWGSDLFVLSRCINYSLAHENHTHCILPCCLAFAFFLDIAKEYSFDAIKSDDIVSSLYNDESVVYEIKKHLDIKPNQDNLQAVVKKLFFTSNKSPLIS